MITKRIVAAVALASLALPAWAQFPRESIDGIELGTAETFVGLWAVGYPDTEGTVFRTQLVDCAAPVEITSRQEGAVLVYVSPASAEPGIFEVSEFSGRTTWMPEHYESSVAVWIEPDAFYLYPVDIETGSARWHNPLLYTRCAADGTS